MLRPIPFLLLLLPVFAKAQSEPQMTLFMQQPVVWNAGAAAERGLPTFCAAYRQQWLGLKGAPTTQVLSFNTPFLNSQRLGLGINLQNQTLGIQQMQAASLALSYAVVKTAHFALRIGLQSSMRRYTEQIDRSREVILIENDPSVPFNMPPRYLANFGAGLYITYRDAFFGIAVPYYRANDLGVNPTNPTIATEQAHLYISAGVSMPLNDNLFLRPIVMYRRAKNAPWNLDAHLGAVLKDAYIVGVSYRVGEGNLTRLGESVALIVSLPLVKGMNMSLSYDYSISAIQQFQSGSVEAALRYDLGSKSLNFSNPRGYF